LYTVSVQNKDQKEKKSFIEIQDLKFKSEIFSAWSLFEWRRLFSEFQ